MPPKAIWESKTFWLNVLGAGVQLLNSGVLDAVDPAYLMLAQAGLNVALRLVTDSPATLTGR